MDDLISRKDAIEAVKKYYRAHDNDLLELIAFDIERLPSAQPEHDENDLDYNDCTRYDTLKRMLEDIVAETKEGAEHKTGRWIDRNDNVATCSVCGDRWGLYRLLNYCPNCGARMEENEE